MTNYFRFSLAIILLFLLNKNLEAQTADPNDVASIDSIIQAYYEVVSGPAGQERQWARDSTLHYPDARVSIVSEAENGKPQLNEMSLAQFHESSRGIVESGFFEYEIHRVVEERGALSQVWSTYEWKATEDGEVGGRGINSIQLFNDGERYWILSWMYDGRPSAPSVQDKYLPKELRSKGK